MNEVKERLAATEEELVPLTPRPACRSVIHDGDRRAIERACVPVAVAENRTHVAYERVSPSRNDMLVLVVLADSPRVASERSVAQTLAQTLAQTFARTFPRRFLAGCVCAD
eukprot:451201-Prorocentrum_minimum.AAC.3